MAELGTPQADGSRPACEVEFVDERTGHTYAVVAVPVGKLLRLRHAAPGLAEASLAR